MNYAQGQKNWLGIAVVISILLVSYWSTYASIVSIWIRSNTFAHGFLIVPLCAYLIWLKRQEIKPQTYSLDVLAIPVLILVVLIWILGRLAHITVIQQFSAVALLPISAWLFMGRVAVRKIRFPLFYLFFAVPFGEFLIPGLQDFTAAFTVKFLRLVDVPVFWEGRYLYLPNGSFEVAEACSGVRYLIASVALGALYAHINFASSKRRLIFVLLSVLVPIFANGIRAFSIVILANLTDQQVGKGVDHLIYGWFFFGIVMFLLFWLGHQFRDKDINVNLDSKIAHSNTLTKQASEHRLAFVIICSAVLISGPGTFYLMDSSQSRDAVLQVSLPAAKNDWFGPLNTGVDWKPKYVGAVFQGLKQYEKGDKRVFFYVAYYNGQSDGSEVVSSENTLMSPDIWQRVSERKQLVELVRNGKLTVNETTITSNRETLVLWQWFIVSGHSVENPVLVKVYELMERLSGVMPASASIVIAAKYLDEPDEARLVLNEFIRDMLPAVLDSVGT